MKIALIIASILLVGCATNPEVQKSISKDQTMERWPRQH